MAVQRAFKLEWMIRSDTGATNRHGLHNEQYLRTVSAIMRDKRKAPAGHEPCRGYSLMLGIEASDLRSSEDRYSQGMPILSAHQ